MSRLVLRFERQWRRSRRALLSSAAFVGWVVAGVAASFFAARCFAEYGKLTLIVVIAFGLVIAVGALMLFWTAADEHDFWSRGYRVRHPRPQEREHSTLGPHSCAYEEHDSDGNARCFMFKRTFTAGGYPAPSTLSFPTESEWDSVVPAWANGRRSEILARVIEVLGPSASIDHS